MDKAKQPWQEAVAGSAENGRGGGRGRGRDGSSMISDRGAQSYYLALTLRKLGNDDRAEPMLRELVSSGNAALVQSSDSTEAATPGFPRQTTRSRSAAAHYIAGLGYAGLGEKDKAREQFALALKSSPDHLGAKTALGRL
jgi:tetratricopeptide (TPR) repeat protein